MKHYFFYFIILLITASALLPITEESMRNSLWLGIFDKESSIDTIEFEKIGYHDIPRELNIRGVMVEALRWEDRGGKSYILVLSQTGIFPVTVKLKLDNKKIKIGDRAELNVYLFNARNKTARYKKVWSLYDFQDCSHMYIYAGFIRNSLTITDIDNNNIPEITFIYTKSCRPDETTPARKKLFLYEGKTKYAIRGNTVFQPTDLSSDPTGYKIGKKLQNNKVLKTFALQRWNSFQVDEFMKFRYD